MSDHEERILTVALNATGWVVAISALLGARFLWRRA
jgi:hypothetical protein